MCLINDGYQSLPIYVCTQIAKTIYSDVVITQEWFYIVLVHQYITIAIMPVTHL